MTGTWTVEVGVATSRPPRHDATRFVVVQADSAHEAEFIAMDIATATPFRGQRVVMAVSTHITDWPED